jgi:ATP-dependent exoDNAse (exonuclease V) alpha subunit
MALRNDILCKYQNGSLGTVLDMGDNTITVLFDNGNTVEMHRISYDIENNDKKKNMVEIKQFPLRAGYAITIHKSQGQTFDFVNIMAPRCWAPGQLYVALSRARTIKGIHLIELINEKSLITDPKVINYYNKLKEAEACAAA